MVSRKCLRACDNGAIRLAQDPKKSPFSTPPHLREAGDPPHRLLRALIGGPVAFTRESFGDRLFESVGRSYRDQPTTLEALAGVLVSHGRLHSLTMQLDTIGVLLVEWPARGLRPRWEAPSAPPSRAAVARNVAGSSPGELTVQIPYAGRSLGWMHSRTIAPSDTSLLPDLLTEFASQCGRLVMRDWLEEWSLGRLGQPLRLVGLSSAMRDLDRFVETVCESSLPVLLHGEYGTEKLAIAAAIHCCGPRPDKPFVAVDCRAPDGSPSDWLSKTKSGTLYLSAIDRLAAPLQSALPRHLPSRLALWPHNGTQRAPRIIASTTADLTKLALQGGFSKDLATELSVLEATLPPLRERLGDLDALDRDAVARMGYDADHKVSAELIDACLRYDWPANHAELSRLLGRLATMTGSAPIDASAIHRYAPMLSQGKSGLPPTIAAWTPHLATPLDRWALRALDPQDDFPHLDQALARAIRHLGERFEEPIDLAELATIGQVSPLRMSALFRSVIGVSFKKLLRQIRILAACERLAHEPTISITRLAFDVGFGDLSYFERSFRSAIGESPRQFRQHRRFDNHASSMSFLSDSARHSSGSGKDTPEAY